MTTYTEKGTVGWSLHRNNCDFHENVIRNSNLTMTGVSWRMSRSPLLILLKISERGAVLRH
jgi:hypothetical protein